MSYEHVYNMDFHNRESNLKVKYLIIVGNTKILVLGQLDSVWTNNAMLPYSSVGKESTCNAGYSSSIPGSGRSTGEGIGYPFQYSWDSFVAQLVKNLPAMQETWVQSLGWEDPLEKGKATLSSVLPWRMPWTV